MDPERTQRDLFKGNGVGGNRKRPANVIPLIFSKLRLHSFDIGVNITNPRSFIRLRGVQ